MAVVAALAVGLALASIATAAEPRASLTDIEDEVMCPICGTPLNLAEAPQAERERAFIRRQIAQGKTKQEILDTLVAEYGSEVLATPENEGFDLAAWLVPAGGLLVAGAVLFVGVRQWRRRDDRSELEEDAIDSDDAERLNSDLARYDL